MHIAAYRGYATATKVVVSGRVLTNKSAAEPGDHHSLWRNLLDTYRRFATDEVPKLPVTIRCGDHEQTVTTDSEGYYHAELPRGRQSDDQFWFDVTARCIVRGDELSATHEAVAPGAGTQFGIISDLDDTVIETNVTSALTAAKLTFMGNAKTRKPLEGVAALYASLQSGNASRPVNPIFYVSSSPWNLYDLLCHFMVLNEIPAGPIFLRDYGIDRTKFIKTRGHREKLQTALKIMDDYSALPFVLVGDSGQHDACLYAEAAALHSGRIKAIYIRDVDPTTASKRDDDVTEHIKTAGQHGVPMLLAPDSNAMAHHAAQLGLIAARKEAAVEAEVAKDHERPNAGTAAVKEALGVEVRPSESRAP